MAPNAQSSAPAPVSLAQQLPHLAIVDRLVTEFPLVNSALDFGFARYSQLKSSSPLVSSTLDRAEKSFEYVVTAAVVPVLNKMEQPIHYADNKAVQGLDLVQAKIGSLQKQSGELKDSGYKLLDQTKERIATVKTQALTSVQSKVHSVLTLPSNVVPLVDQILSAGENVLDYLLPSSDADADKQQQHNGANQIPEEDETQQDPKDTRALIRLVFVRVRAFSDKVQKRVVDYSRDRWIPALFSKVVIIKGNLAQLVANGAAAGNKLLTQANGHAAQTETAQPQAQSSSTPNPSPVKSASPKKSSSNSTSTKATSTTTPAANGDVNNKTLELQPLSS